MLILLELFANFFEVHYKLLQRILQNFNAGGLFSGWSFVRGWHFQRSFVGTSSVCMEFCRLRLCVYVCRPMYVCDLSMNESINKTHLLGRQLPMITGAVQVTHEVKYLGNQGR